MGQQPSDPQPKTPPA
jgi:serine/threonine protein kinase